MEPIVVWLTDRYTVTIDSTEVSLVDVTTDEELRVWKLEELYSPESILRYTEIITDCCDAGEATVNVTDFYPATIE